ncbi:MAG: hypothetical protein C4581_06095 [Nitrospiraceae bacterium]|nr:MAG: hypothetical protein C4581_06095 [Nitrospiraceae bacterium]
MRDMTRVSILFLSSICFIIILNLTTFSGCDTVKEKHYTVGIINPSTGLEEVVRGFRSGMEEHGYHEGKNITYLYAGPLDSTDRVDPAIDEMLANKVDLIYSLTTPVTKKLKEALTGKEVPGVFGPVFDPVFSGIVESMTRPGGMLTGVSVRGSTPKALEYLHKVAPGVKHVYVPFHFTDDAAFATVEDLRKAAAKLDIQITTENISNAQELENALAHVPDDADALWMTCSHLLFSNVDKIVGAALSSKIPSASSTQSPNRKGIVVAYGESDFQLGKQVSRLAHTILRGTPPSALPVETADFFLRIDLKAAQALGINVPGNILRQANYIDR